jgi:hypothetical protein
MSNTKGIIYFVQPAELLGTQRYKVGCSSKSHLQRCTSGYRSGTRYLLIMEYAEPFAIEKIIKKLFTSKYKLIAGTEYFEGNEIEMIHDFFNCAMNISSVQTSNSNSDAFTMLTNLVNDVIKSNIQMVEYNKSLVQNNKIMIDTMCKNGSTVNNQQYHDEQS